MCTTKNLKDFTSQSYDCSSEKFNLKTDSEKHVCLFIYSGTIDRNEKKKKKLLYLLNAVLKNLKII